MAKLLARSMEQREHGGRCWMCIAVGGLVGLAIGMGVVALLLGGTAHGQGPSGSGEGPAEAPRRLVPDGFAMSESARAAIEAPWLTDAERAAGRIFHGVWDERDLATDELRARAALITGRFDDPVFGDDGELAANLPLELQAQAMLGRGELQRMLDLIDAAGKAEGWATLLHRQWLKTEALWRMGQHEPAREAAALGLAVPVDGTDATAGMLVDRAKLLELDAKLNGATEASSREMMELLGRAHQSVDRLYWPAMVEEGRILARKHNRQQAVEALHGALELNPRSAAAWYELGRIALDVFAFEEAERAMAALERLDDRHVFALLLRAELRMTEDDPEGAMDVLDEALARHPGHRRALALRVAAASLMYGEPNRLEEARARYEERSPGAAQAAHEAGRYLSFHRQYDAAAAMLDEARRRAPNWLEPTVELGVMHTQTGDDAQAAALLRDAVQAEPFNMRAGNALELMEALLGFETIETERFIVRYRPGVDEAVAAMMPAELERMHDIVGGRFDWEPPRKTIVELMPDHAHFAVRITGMPDVYTIAACTGPIIAMEAPREGGAGTHTGLYDWVRVARHEYTHTVTLDLTENRIPHWLTEAAAVMMELAPREYGDCVMLAESWRRGTLFDLEEINWAFVRPKRPGDRGKAYAQGHWMLE
ncbi:MAG: tetratricopeptide repeat protein, partial [Pseudomonadales bacterium]|nr:tetratricopeptide repeat protein [Pseudomonadales bacterium]